MPVRRLQNLLSVAKTTSCLPIFCVLHKQNIVFAGYRMYAESASGGVSSGYVLRSCFWQKKDCLDGAIFFYNKLSVSVYFAASMEAFLNAFNDFSSYKEALRARAPAALFPFST